MHFSSRPTPWGKPRLPRLTPPSEDSAGSVRSQRSWSPSTALWARLPDSRGEITNSIQLLAWLGNRFGKPPGFERIVRWFASPEKCSHLPELCLVRDGLIFLARPGVQVDWHVLFFGSYEPEARNIFRTVLPLGGVAVDVGANVGWHTLLMASLVGAGGRVLAIEPNPDLRRRLHNHLCLNHFSQAEIIPCAAADTERMTDFYAPAAKDLDSGNGHVVEAGHAENASTIRVETRRMDAIASAAGVERLDLIKIDVEGFEWPVLRGGENTIAKFRPHIVFEYNAESASRGGGTPELISKFFRTHRYRLFSIGQTWAAEIEGDEWPRSGDIWAVPIP
jgi:FkbM family methyltransferase